MRRRQTLPLLSARVKAACTESLSPASPDRPTSRRKFRDCAFRFGACWRRTTGAGQRALRASGRRGRGGRLPPRQQRRSNAGHLAGIWAVAGEAARHLDAEVNRHDRRCFVMIKEDVVSIGSEAGILVQEGPDLIQRRPEFLRDAIHRHALAHRYFQLSLRRNGRLATNQLRSAPAGRKQQSPLAVVRWQ